MGMTIEELITFCEEEEYNHRLSCKRCDDASGYTRSKNKDIRTACAVREELLGDYYKQIASIMRKYQQIEEIYKNWCYSTYFNATDAMNKLGEVLKDGEID